MVVFPYRYQLDTQGRRYCTENFSICQPYFGAENINNLRAVAHTTETTSRADTLKGSLTKTGSILPDIMDDANFMRAKVFELYNAWSDKAKANSPDILSEVKLWIKVLKSASTDMAFQIYIANKFHTHMKFGLHSAAATDFDIGDRRL